MACIMCNSQTYHLHGCTQTGWANVGNGGITVKNQIIKERPNVKWTSVTFKPKAKSVEYSLDLLLRRELVGGDVNLLAAPSLNNRDLHQSWMDVAAT